MFDNKEDGSKYLQLYNYYKKLITDSVLKSNDKIPSIRKCARAFELSRTTVETAYEMLAAEGYIISKAQSGFYVCDVDFTLSNKNEQIKSENVENKRVKYDLVSSCADKASFNFALWRRYVKSALRQDERLLSYGEPQGESDLREVICNFIAKERGVVCSPSQIVVAAGTQNLIGILCAVISEKKKVAFIGSDFTRGKAIFEDYGREIVNLQKEDENCIDVKNSFIYTSPSHNDKLGNVMTSKERIKLLNYARENNCIIIEDDYDSEFRYCTRSVPSLQGMDGGNNVVYIGTFSKLLLPSIRISFMVLPMKQLEKYNERKKLYNQTASKAEQIALCQYIRDGHLSQQIKKQKKQYISKVKFICDRAAQILAPEISFSQCQSGYLIIVSVKTELSEEEVVKKALENEIFLKSAGKENGTVELIISVAGFNVLDTDDLLLRFAQLLKEI